MNQLENPSKTYVVRTTVLSSNDELPCDPGDILETKPHTSSGVQNGPRAKLRIWYIDKVGFES